VSVTGSSGFKRRELLDELIELDELLESARRVLEQRVDRRALLQRSAVPAHFDRDLWKVVADLGWLGLTVPQERGGLGQSFVVLAALYRELGGALAVIPFASAAIGLQVLTGYEVGTVAAGLIEAAMAGDAVVVPVSTGAGACAMHMRGRMPVLSGVIRTALDAGHGTHLWVPIPGAIPALALIPLPHPAVVISHRPTWDRTRQVFDVQFDNLPIDENWLVLRGEVASNALSQIAAHFDLALACDAVGGADAIFGETLAYMNARRQFNRTIASFQALKHRCADLKAAMEAARALLNASCRAFAQSEGEWQAMAAGCRLYAEAVYRRVTEEAVQFHGGIGFTWEHSCHLFLKRAGLSEVLGRSTEQRKDAIAPTFFRGAREYAGSLLTHALGGRAA
jgi:alkylation response protein AidB-like acyl-CoA dehydrogenase